MLACPIFLLFYLKYDPEMYQKQAMLTAPDEYGFGQVEKFDKFIFEFKWPKDLQKTQYSSVRLTISKIFLNNIKLIQVN